MKSIKLNNLTSLAIAVAVLTLADCSPSETPVVAEEDLNDFEVGPVLDTGE